jgi:hypothetical protein
MQRMSRVLLGIGLVAALAIGPASGVTLAASAAGSGKHGAKAVVRDNNPTARTHAEITADGHAYVYFTPDYLAPKLGVTTAVLQQDLQAGETLLQIAGSAYASAHDLAVALVAPFKIKFDHAAASGGLDAAKASQMYNSLLAAVESEVVTPHLQLASPESDRPKDGASSPSDRAGDRAGGLFASLKATVMTTVASSCNTTVDAFQTALQAGSQTPLAVCQATNPNATVASISAAVSAVVKPQLDAAVAAGQITAADESQWLGNLQALSAWLTTPNGTPVSKS